MTTDTVIVRYSELGLKGKNRNEFEKKLVWNIKECLNQNEIVHDRVRRIRGRIFIDGPSKCDQLEQVFGIQSFSPAVSTRPDVEHIKEAVEGFLTGVDKETSFRISAHRGDKTVPFTSEDLERGIGAFVVDTTGAKVSLKKFDLEISIEIYEGKAYVFAKRKPGPGGLPVGSSGKVCLFYETERSIAAGWLMMKRGCDISIICKEKTEEMEKLIRIAYGIHIDVIEGGIERFLEMDCAAGVSEQGISNLEKYPIDAVILRPLVGYTEEEIKDILSKVY